ncbi:MAG: tetratricopeptide repeat protein [Chitinophagaceae bacterium]|nr:tetratricopeptide repeat protein [Chitinophagaceae bacterium]
MRILLQQIAIGSFAAGLIALSACTQKKTEPSNDEITAIDLKRGEVILCGPPEKEFGAVGFESSCSQAVKEDFSLAIALLHSFEYDEAEKVFAKVIDKEPGCPLAYWGVAMANYHPLWAPPTPEEFEKGSKAIAIARSLKPGSKKESDYIDAIAVFYKDWQKVDHATRSNNYEKAMEKLYATYPDDKEAGIFYALALDGAANPSDKTYAKQKKAGDVLNAIYPDQPVHPGIIHYIIHSYDNPELAGLALSAARKYASIAPSSAHAQHMPSHIFTRLGKWDESISSNLVASSSAKCYGESTGIKGHWDEELHTLDYLIYAYLQRGDNLHAKQQIDYLRSIKEVFPINFKVAYAFAAGPARYALENKLWKEAASHQLYPQTLEWEKYPWQKAIFHFAKLMGNVNINQLDSAKLELRNLSQLHDTLTRQKDTYKANQVQIQMKTGESWILFKQGKRDQGLALMSAAADLEDKTQKHSVTPGEVIPARESLAEMLMQMNKSVEALKAYEAVLKQQPNRFNALYGAAVASERIKNAEKAGQYYSQLLAISFTESTRPELGKAKEYLQSHDQGLTRR